MRAAGALQAVAGGGTETLFLPRDSRPTAETIAALLTLAWKQSDVNRIRLARGA
jgi:hypothetical protein